MRSLFKQFVVRVITLEARAVLRIYKPNVIAVTGSVGKTSTKDAIFAALCPHAHVRKSQKSFNSEIGVPLTILGVPNGWYNPLRWLINIVDGLFLIWFRARYPEWLVLEVGADRPGDIRSIASWLKVNVAVITRLPQVPVHVEFFDSPEAVAEEKAALLTALVPGGTAVIYGDDALTRSLERRLPELPGVKLMTFGFSEECDVRGTDVHPVREGGWPLGMQARIEVPDAQAQLQIRGALGAHAFLPALGAVAAALAVGESLDGAVSGLRGYEPPPGRMHLIDGIKDTLVIDDTYNASPAATEAALESLDLAKRPGRRAVACLGDMLELGRLSVEEHRKIGALVARHCDKLLTVGFRARDIAQGALDGGMKDADILQFEDSRKAGEELQNVLQ